MAQPTTLPADTLPFRQIPDYPATYTAKTMLVRMIDGLGFRYYWATDALTAHDLAHKPTPEARTTEHTIDHILGLTTIIANAVQRKVNTRSDDETSALMFAQKQQLTLRNLKTARDLLLIQTDSVSDYKLLFGNGSKTVSYPVWNLINGPLEDALWHVGQVVSFRRSSGNPIDSKVNVLTGKVGE
ncbi:hypothetical protein GCM10027423_26180 [Spirosoma arcticum]